MSYDPNQYCDAVQFSGFTSDYTRMSHFQQLPTYNNYSVGSSNSVFNYPTYSNYSTVGTNNQSALLQGLGGIFNAIGSMMIVNDQAKAQQKYQSMQYQAYRQQAAQLDEQQQQQQLMGGMQSMLQMTLMMKLFDNPDLLKKLAGEKATT